MPELTLFATPKAFRGQFARIQTNAAKSWAALGPSVEVVLIGDDEGTAQVCADLSLRHVPQVARSPKNVPLLDDLWLTGQAVANAPICLFTNADIMFTDDLLGALSAVRAQVDGPFLVIGQRCDLELDVDIDTDEPGWGVALRARAHAEGWLNSPLWVDWFAFERGQFPKLPPFVIGRPGYDHWLVWHALSRGLAVIDATDAVCAIHQHHDYSHGGNHRDVWFGDDASTNRALIGGRSHMRHIGHATHRLDASLQLRPATGTKYVLSRAHSRLAPVLERTMGIRHRLGIDAEHVQRLAPRARRA